MRQIVFISVDCLRADHLGCYGYERSTSPNIDKLASEATIFESSYSNCPGTRWAFQSLHTGVSTAKIDGLGIPEDYWPLATHLSDHGYSTGGFAVNGFVSRDYRYNTGYDTYYSVKDSSSEHGLLKRAGRKVNNTLDSEFVRDYLLKPVHDRFRSSKTDVNNRFQPAHTDRDTADQALSFVNNNRDEPFFLWVHLMDAHTPYGYWPDHLRELHGDTDIEHTIHPGQEGLIEPGTKPPQNVIDTYDAGIRSADEQIGRLLEEIPDEATVVFTGDHGEEFGRFGAFHEASLYGTMTQVPIIVRDTDLESGRTEHPAQHLDIPATLLHAADIDRPDNWEGKPLQVFERNLDDPIFYALGPQRVAVRVGDWKYIESESDGELYQVSHSEKETEQTYDREKREELQSLVEAYRDSTSSIGVGQSELDDDSDLSEEVEENLEDLGYL